MPDLSALSPAPAFQHRALLGWISEFINRTLPGIWPQIPLDDETLADLDGYFALCRESGYNEVILWGLFVDRRWPLDIVSCVNDDRRERIGRVIAGARSHGLTILGGLGLYSWGFEAIIEAHPELSRTNRRALCPSVPESHVWMRRVVDFIFDGFDLDGLNMQSADQGRCSCDECKPLTDREYHARLNREIAQYIRSRWPGKILFMDNWGCPLTGPDDIAPLADVSRHLDAIIDTDDSAERVGREFRRDLIAALSCGFGTLAGRSVWPPQRWSNEKWFLPTSLTNVDYIRRLHDDGGRAAEQFVTTLANPSGEITLRFMAALLNDVTADPQTVLRDVVSRVYAPHDDATRDKLAAVIRGTEFAYFGDESQTPLRNSDLLCIDGGFHYDKLPNPETYLLAMTPERLAAYIADMTRLAQEFDRLRPALAQSAKADKTACCLQNVLADAQRIRDEKPQ